MGTDLRAAQTVRSGVRVNKCQITLEFSAGCPFLLHAALVAPRDSTHALRASLSERGASAIKSLPQRSQVHGPACMQQSYVSGRAVVE